ncbi:MAG: helix-turn-helix domain-containing protein [Pseudomonadota bacterium]|nr:helix-turn-helix domain-containing protein [Pseudomonadota bacterium]
MQLTQEERYQIYILKKAEYSQAEIAELLERDKSTISRELRRNRGLKGYRPRQAHSLACCGVTTRRSPALVPGLAAGRGTDPRGRSSTAY